VFSKDIIPVYVPAVKPTSAAPVPVETSAITISAPVLFDNPIVLSAFKTATTPETDSFILSTNEE